MSLLSKFVSPDSPEFHSHAIAKSDETQAQTIGSTDKSTFLQRKALEHNRQLVGGYQTAGVHEDTRREFKPNQSPIVPLREANKQSASSSYLKRREQSAGAPGRNPAATITPIARPTFAEPQTRRFNPYG